MRIGDVVTTAGNHRSMLPDEEGGAAAMTASSSTASTPCANGRHPLALGRHPEEAGAIGWEHDVDLDGNPGRTPGGCSQRLPVHRWVPGTSGGCSRTLRESRARRGLGTSGSAAHVRLTAVRRWHGDREDRTACRPRQQPVTETVYRQELRPLLQQGAKVMDRLFGSVNSGPTTRPRRA
jgi:hypothetical protein